MRQDPQLPARRSVRLPQFDYGQPSAYFLTICTHQKRHLLGTVSGHEVALSRRGKLVDECWRGIPVHSPNVELGPYVVMPNHLHGVIVIRSRATAGSRSSQRIGALGAGSIPTIVRSFKAITTRRIHDDFGEVGTVIWQRGYYEHIIWSQDEFNKIREYIRLNPANWSNDEENL